MKKQKTKIILSGGGTGGHIYPAVAVAEALTKKLGDNMEILFVGAEGKMEMEKIPALGYNIVGLPVAGIKRSLSLENLSLPLKISRSLKKARKTIKSFKADIVVGFGGYASGPVLWSAQQMGIPTIIQEQNSYAGLTNKILSKKAKHICVAYDGMDKFFPADKIAMTGNPLRGNFSDTGADRTEALEYFGMKAGKPVILVLGGSLGTRTLNNMMKRHADYILKEDKVQVIWQTGKFYEEEMLEFMEDKKGYNIWKGAFIDRMDYAYSAADVVISRSGANTVSELCLVGKPVIFVPSPNVAEDHQTKNAAALVEKDAAVMIPDREAVETGIPEAMRLLDDKAGLSKLSGNIKRLARPHAADEIAGLIIKTLESSKK